MFRLPSSVRPTLPTGSAGQTEYPVTTDAQMRAAIGKIAARAGNSASGNAAAFGSRITICAPLTFSSPYVIPPQCGGLEICAAGYVPLLPRGLVACLFEVHAQVLSLTGLLLAAVDAINKADTFFLTSTDACQRARVTGCVSNADHFILDAGGKMDRSVFRDNTSIAVTTSADPVVQSASQSVRYAGNQHDSGTHPTKEVLLLAGASRWAITGNTFNGRGVDVDAGTFSSVTGNTLAGTVTATGTNAQAGNT